MFFYSKREQLIMWWGGLRGAVGFSLAMVLKEEMWYRYQSSSCHPSYIIWLNHSSSLKIYDCGCSSMSKLITVGMWCDQWLKQQYDQNKAIAWPVNKANMWQGTFPDNGPCHGPLHSLPTGRHRLLDDDWANFLLDLENDFNSCENMIEMKRSLQSKTQLTSLMWKRLDRSCVICFKFEQIKSFDQGGMNKLSQI